MLLSLSEPLKKDLLNLTSSINNFFYLFKTSAFGFKLFFSCPVFISLISPPSFSSTLLFLHTHSCHLSPAWPCGLPVSWSTLQAKFSKDSTLSPAAVTHLCTKLHIFWSKMSVWLDSSSGCHWARYLTSLGFTYVICKTGETLSHR